MFGVDSDYFEHAESIADVFYAFGVHLLPFSTFFTISDGPDRQKTGLPHLVLYLTMNDIG